MLKEISLKLVVETWW